MSDEQRATPGPFTVRRGPEGFQFIDAAGRMWCDGMGSAEASVLLPMLNDHRALLDRAQRAAEQGGAKDCEVAGLRERVDELTERATKAEGDAAFVDIYEGRALDRPRAAEVARAALRSDAGAALLAVVHAAEKDRQWRDKHQPNHTGPEDCTGCLARASLDALLDALRRSRG